MSRESDIIDYIKSKDCPVSLSDLTRAIAGNYSEAQIYASANQACTKQKIARGPEPNTYCRMDYAGARVSKSSVVIKQDPLPKTWTEKLETPMEMEVKPKRQRKPQVIGRFDLDQVVEDLLAMGLEQVPKHKLESFIGVPILPPEKRDHEYCHDAEYIMERGTKTYKSRPTRFTVMSVGPTPYVGVYP